MKIDTVNYKKVDKSILIASLASGDFEKPSKNQLKELIKKFGSAVDLGDYISARNTLIVSIHFQLEDTFDAIKRKGYFRYSKYINRKCIVKHIASELIEICKSQGCLTDQINIYLTSIINYSAILDSYNTFDKFALSEIKKFEKNFPGKSLIKTLLAYVDFLFLSDHYPKTKDDLSNISGRTKEDICLATSFLIHFYTERIKNQDIDITYVAEEYVMSSGIVKLIIPVCYHLDFKEFEILIDHFGYECNIKDEILLIKPPFEDFEKSVRLGYIRTDIQSFNDRFESPETTSIEELVDELNKQDSLQFFKLIETHNYQRYRVEIPEPVYDFLIEKFIKPNELFREELIYLSSIFKEQLLNPIELEKIRIKDHLTLGEFVKIHRIFTIFYLLFAKEIYKKEKIETKLLLRSLIPVYPADLFYEFMEKLLPTRKIDSFLDIVCWEPGLDKVFDLQYHSILFFNNHFLIPLSIFANSNKIRNLYASEYKQNNSQLLSDGEIDPLVDKLCASLAYASLEYYSQTSIGSTDIDVFVIYGNTLFVFECKHTLHPASTFDLRTTYDYIKKAESQLDLTIAEFYNGNLTEKIKRIYGLELVGIVRIQGVIVLSNRLFNGNIFRYPVRNINEIDNMINRGTMRTKDGEFWLWREKKLTISFLINYFSLDNELVQLLYDSLSKITLTYEFVRPVIKFDTYVLEVQGANLRMKEFTDNLEKAENFDE